MGGIVLTDYVSYNGKKLRKGYTTGSCATAATMAAIEILKTGHPVHQVNLTTPSGVELVIPIENTILTAQGVSCSVIKDGGDDADATHGMHIYSTVHYNDKGIIQLDGGEGVGRVTQPGLRVPVGEAAINPTPRKMITEAAEHLLPKGQGITITITAPGGEKVALNTMNPKLGIVGGISILGTSGIVTPMSEDSWKHAITVEMEQLYLKGHDKIVLVPGNYGENFLKEQTSINFDYAVQMSNFVGYVLLEVMRIGFKKVLLVGHLGKFIKIAGGIFSTHSKDSDARNEIMIANLALLDAPLSLLQAVDAALTTEAQYVVIKEAGYEAVYQHIVDKIKERALKLLKFRAPEIEIEAITFLTQYHLVVSTKPLTQLEEEWQ